MTKRLATLMYHELSRPGEPLCESDRGYAKYAVDGGLFGEHMQRLATEGFQGVSVSRALADADDSATVAVSFDDGCATDLTIAAPALARLGFTATSYVTTGFLGRRGFLTPSLLRELADAGAEIGSHAVTHRFLTDLSDSDLTSEVADSRHQLEQIIGRPVTHFSCPGGRFDRRVVDAVRRAGYTSMATSRIGLHEPGGDVFNLPRIVVTAGATAEYVASVSRGQGLATRRLRSAVLDAAKAMLGNRVYVALRAVTFGDRSR